MNDNIRMSNFEKKTNEYKNDATNRQSEKKCYNNVILYTFKI